MSEGDDMVQTGRARTVLEHYEKHLQCASWAVSLWSVDAAPRAAYANHLSPAAQRADTSAMCAYEISNGSLHVTFGVQASSSMK